MVPQIHRCSFLAYPPHPCASTFLFSTYHLTYCVFSTLTTTLLPKIALPSSHPIHRDNDSDKRMNGVKVSPSQSGKFFQQVASSHFFAIVAPSNDSAISPKPIKSTVPVTPRATWSSSEGKRQTDWLHSLSLGHYTAVSNPVYSFIFLLLVFSYTPVLSEKPLTPITFLVSNTGALWKDEWWQNRWEEGWGKARVWRGGERQVNRLNEPAESRQVDWTGWTGCFFNSKRKRTRHQCITACTTKYVMWLQQCF